MFAELDGYDRLDDLIQVSGAEHKARMVENMRRWRIANPKKHRALARKNLKSYRKRNPDKVRALKNAYNARNREHMREVWKRNQLARTARKKASK